MRHDGRWDFAVQGPVTMRHKRCAIVLDGVTIDQAKLMRDLQQELEQKTDELKRVKRQRDTALALLGQRTPDRNDTTAQRALVREVERTG